ncbi:MAG: hypothetical protein R2824_25500 [Saprospiraceae bacterium]|nr:hypothetical protein [Lewinella sp.]
MTPAPDRLQELVGQDQVAGMDFVYVYEDQVRLDIYFHPLTAIPADPNPLNVNPLVGNVLAGQIRIYCPETGETISDVSLRTLPSPTSWSAVDDRAVLHIQTPAPGGFTNYRLFIDSPDIDPYYNNILFRFKANCPSDLDCAPPPHECPPEELVDFPVDYRARDFWSYRRALLDFASLRYPDWNDRLEADAGIMLVEVMSALGDELAYYQDRIGREAYLETATQRRSVRRHARLVDYNVHDGLGAFTWLDFTVVPPGGIGQQVPAGMDVYALSDNGRAVYFEVGRGMEETVAGKLFPVDFNNNAFDPHIWDEDDVCLPVGATEMYIAGHQEGNLTPFDDLPPGKAPGKWVLIKTTPDDPAIPARDHMVRLIQATNTQDPVFNTAITHLIWEEAQALPFEMNMSFMQVRGNLVPATAGRMTEQLFVVGEDPGNLPIPPTERAQLERAVERQGRDQTLTYLYSLPGSDQTLLVWLGEDTSHAVPEVRLTEVVYNVVSGEWDEVNEWDWRRSLIGVVSSQGQDDDYTLDDGSWKRVVGYQRNGEEIVHKDYTSNAGKTIRFGDGEFGLVPEKEAVFKVQFRLGGGEAANVAADTLTQFDTSAFPFVASVTNPLTAIEGVDPEPLREVRQLASEAFRAITYRAVRPEDYAEAVERLPQVQRAGASFRWTGSWLSAFVTPDLQGTVTISEENRSILTRQLDRFRQAGREAHLLDPIYVSIDLVITICVSPHAYPGEVKEMVLEKLFGKGGVRLKPGYFSPDNYTFGTVLDRSTLEATIQSVSGVQAVERITIARRGWFKERLFKEWVYEPGKNAIIRIDNDPRYPERGTVKLKMKGGA